MFGGDSGGKRIPVTLTMSDGKQLSGSVPAGPAASLSTELNREGLFLNFKDKGGQTLFIAKASIAMVIEGDGVKEAKLPQLMDGRSPHKVLRVAPDASPDVIRQAFLTLARQYHPDHFSGETVPSEIRDYAAAMFQQINDAYQTMRASTPSQPAAATRFG